MYHEGYSGGNLLLSDSLFKGNTANSGGSRGGGAFEDYRNTDYQSAYSFSFFTRNTAENGAGNDISVQYSAFTDSPLTYCFTTTAENAFYNAGSYKPYWLPLGTMSFPINDSIDPLSDDIIILRTRKIISDDKALLLHYHLLIYLLLGYHRENNTLFHVLKFFLH